MNKINKATLNLIKEFEGLELSAYKDAVGVWTIGYGHTAAAGKPYPVAGMKISNVEAENLLLRDLVIYEGAVRESVKVPLTDNQYGALVSFTYNLGPGNFKKSTLLKKVNNKDFAGAANEFAKWNKAKGKVLPGLTRRRSAEKALFLSAAPGGTVAPVQTIPAPVPVETVKPPVAPLPEPSMTFLGKILQLILKLFKK